MTVKINESWPDFVFRDDYELLPLEQLDLFIADNGHLPGIPTESEVMAEGVKLGEMESLLLRKVEELTLYLIRQHAVIKELKRSIEKTTEDTLK